MGAPCRLPAEGGSCLLSCPHRLKATARGQVGSTLRGDNRTADFRQAGLQVREVILPRHATERRGGLKGDACMAASSREGGASAAVELAHLARVSLLMPGPGGADDGRKV